MRDNSEQRENTPTLFETVDRYIKQHPGMDWPKLSKLIISTVDIQMPAETLYAQIQKGIVSRPVFQAMRFLGVVPADASPEDYGLRYVTKGKFNMEESNGLRLKYKEFRSAKYARRLRDEIVSDGGEARLQDRMAGIRGGSASSGGRSD